MIPFGPVEAVGPVGAVAPLQYGWDTFFLKKRLTRIANKSENVVSLLNERRGQLGPPRNSKAYKAPTL
jgi:hypothetical protein